MHLPLTGDEIAVMQPQCLAGPQFASRGVLWRAGVRWVVVELSSTRARSWAPYATPVYGNETTVVLRLEAP